LKGRHDNQPIDGVGGGGGTGETMRTGGTRGGGGRLPIVFSGGEWSDEKKENREGMGPWILMALLKIWARRRAGQRRFGRTPSHLFGLRIKGQKNK
jgi:hypothetical protein